MHEINNDVMDNTSNELVDEHVTTPANKQQKENLMDDDPDLIPDGPVTTSPDTDHISGLQKSHMI